MVNILEALRSCDALIDGHFVLNSGKHSAQYINKDRLLMYPKLLDSVAQSLAKMIVGTDPSVQVIAGPAIAGAILAQRVGSYAGEMVVYAEKHPEIPGMFLFNRGYGDVIAGKRVAVVEDVVTTGSSALGVAEAVVRAKGLLSGIFALVNRGGVKLPYLHALADLNIESWQAVECPQCKAKVPVSLTVGHGVRAVLRG